MTNNVKTWTIRFFTLMVPFTVATNIDINRQLQYRCHQTGIPTIPVLSHITPVMSDLGLRSHAAQVQLHEDVYVNWSNQPKCSDLRNN